MSLRVVPINQRDARQFVAAWHRHHLPPPGSVFQLAVADDEDVLPNPLGGNRMNLDRGAGVRNP